MHPIHIKASGRPLVAWRNGAGSTREIACHVAGGGHCLDWRISRARITGPARFSDFAGCDRTLVLASGGPLVLDGISGGGLAAVGAMVSFPGEQAISAARAGGGTEVINLFAGRHWGYAEVLIASASIVVPPCAAGVILPLQAPLRVRAGPRTYLLLPGDALVFEDTANEIACDLSDRAVLALFRAHAA